jgi:acyl-CoA synthetase (AMP-forming)/AMP-acid ligase II
VLSAARGLARRGARTVGLVRSSGVLSSVSPFGLARFARDAAGQRVGPHLAVMFHAAATPAREALVAGERRLSYGELDGQVNQLGQALVARGVRPGDRVGLMLPNVPEFVIALLALERIGACAAQIGARLRRGEISHILENAAPRALIYHADVADELEPALAAAPAALSLRIVVAPRRGDAAHGSAEAWPAVLASHDGRRPPPRPATTGGGVIVYTSGTTGRPKGARRGWSQTGLESVTDLLASVGARSDDRHLVTCPLYHSGALGFTMLALVLGSTAVLVERFEADEALAVIERERITTSFVVPTLLNRLIAVAPAERRRRDLSSLRWILSGAAPLTTESARRFQAAYGPILWNFYGATETGMVTLAAPTDHERRPGTVGRCLAGSEVRILDVGGHALPTGEVGEVYVRSRMLIEGYHGDAAATSAAMRDGFFSVGDLGRLDADGYLYLASRKHDMVISGGVNIYPAEIEEELARHPDIVEAAVVGVPDPEWGESLVAFVVPRAGATLSEEAVVAHCRASLADFKRPRRVELVAELPRNPTGKILKRELRERLGNS